jgi:hypothetical protein
LRARHSPARRLVETDESRDEAKDLYARTPLESSRAACNLFRVAGI